MSGLVGIFYKNKTLENATIIDNLICHLAHRGVDGIEKKEYENASFAYLKTINLPESKWETQFEDNEIFVIADARVDAREVLFKNLELPFDNNTTPTQLIAFAFKKWKKEILKHVIGDFAFIIYDKKSYEIIVGKDHMGIRPLFYFIKNDEYIAFASEIEALKRLPDFKSEIDEDYIQYYLNRQKGLEYGKFDKTIFKHVKRIMASSLYNFKNDLNFKIDETWATYDYYNESFFEADPSIEKVGEEFLRLLKLAIKDRNRSEFRISSDFSGGLDSSTVAILSSKINEKPLITFNNYIPDDRFNESKYIRDSLSNYNIEHFWLENNYNFINTLDFNESINDPCFFNSPYSWFHENRIKIMKQKGSRTYLTGHDGDTVVSSGWEYYDLLLKNKKYKEFKKASLQNNSFVKVELEYFSTRVLSLESKTQNFMYKNFFIKYFLLLIRNKDYVGSFQLFFNFIKIKGIPFWIFIRHIFKFFKKEKKFDEQIEIELEPYSNEYNLNFCELEHLNQIRMRGIIISNENLSSYFSKHQIETLFPFYDKRLIDFCVKVPLAYKFNNGLGRGTIRNAVKEILPKIIIERTSKMDGSIYIKDKMLENIDEFIMLYKKAFEKVPKLKDSKIFEPDDFAEKMLQIKESKVFLNDLARQLRFNYFLVSWLADRL